MRFTQCHNLICTWESDTCLTRNECRCKILWKHELFSEEIIMCSLKPLLSLLVEARGTFLGLQTLYVSCQLSVPGENHILASLWLQESDIFTSMAWSFLGNWLVMTWLHLFPLTCFHCMFSYFSTLSLYIIACYYKRNTNMNF